MKWTSFYSSAAYRGVRLTILVWMGAVILAAFSFGGMWLSIPRIPILEHTARNLYFHVPMWFTMMGLAAVSAYHSLRYLHIRLPEQDLRAKEAAKVSVLFGILGLATGSIWAHYTWYEGTNIWWNFDPETNPSGGSDPDIRSLLRAEERAG